MLIVNRISCIIDGSKISSASCAAAGTGKERANVRTDATVA